MFDLNFLRGLLFCLRLSLITWFSKCVAPLYVILRLIWVSVIFYIFIIIRIWWQLLLPFIPHNKLFILLLQWQWLFRIGSRFLQILIWLIYLFKFLLLIIMLDHRCFTQSIALLVRQHQFLSDLLKILILLLSALKNIESGYSWFVGKDVSGDLFEYRMLWWVLCKFFIGVVVIHIVSHS